jgi:hypothetical protein
MECGVKHISGRRKNNMSFEQTTHGTMTHEADEIHAAEDKSLQRLLDKGGVLASQLAQEHLTDLDYILGQRYFNLLLKHVREKKKNGETDIELRYGELVDRLKKEYATKPHTKAAIAVNIGRRLYATQRICELCKLPNLAGMAVNGSESQGRSYKGNWALEKQAILERDWDADVGAVEKQFDIQRDEIKGRKRSLAERLRSVVEDYYYRDIYKKNEELLKPLVTMEHKEQIIGLLLDGVSPEDAVHQVVGARIVVQRI